MNILYEVPTANEYTELRSRVGLSPKDNTMVEMALLNSIFTVSIRDDDATLLGMGRIIGDRGCFFQIVDVMVNPAHQAQAFDKIIMRELMDYLDQTAPKDAAIMVITDLAAISLYKQYGFELTYPNLYSMYRKENTNL